MWFRACLSAAKSALLGGGEFETRASTPLSQGAVPEGWLPEPVRVSVSEDLVAELRLRQEDILRRVGEIRAKHGIEAKVRILDDMLLASRKYDVAINGIRVIGCSLEPRDDLESHLVATLDAVCGQYADAIRFFSHQHAFSSSSSSS